MFDHNHADDAFVRGGFWTIVSATEGSVQMGGGITQLIGLSHDTEVTMTVEDEGGAQYDITFTFVDDPDRVVISSITAL